MDKNLAIRSINRFNEIGLFDMEYIKERIPMDKDKLIEVIEWLYSDDERIKQMTWLIETDDDTFRTHKWFAKKWIEMRDFRAGCKTFKHLKLF